jgi:chemotaxis protein CheZ
LYAIFLDKVSIFMSDDTRLALAKKLVTALEQDNSQEAEQLLDDLTSLKQTQLFKEIGKLTRHLHDTLSMFTADSNLAVFTEQEIPDTQERLRYVISVTEQAANQTLAAVETILPITQDLNAQANKLAAKWEIFLMRKMPYAEFMALSGELTQHFQGSTAALAEIQSGLTTILMAQGYQDITGQIITKVIKFVHELEESLVNLIREVGGKKTGSREPVAKVALPGPVVPGVDDKLSDSASSQDEVDDLLSSLGF